MLTKKHDENMLSAQCTDSIEELQVISAKSQVVAGIKWNFEVLYGETQCKKGVNYTDRDRQTVLEKNETICRMFPKMRSNRAMRTAS